MRWRAWLCLPPCPALRAGCDGCGHRRAGWGTVGGLVKCWGFDISCSGRRLGGGGAQRAVPAGGSRTRPLGAQVLAAGRAARRAARRGRARCYGGVRAEGSPTPPRVEPPDTRGGGPARGPAGGDIAAAALLLAGGARTSRRLAAPRRTGCAAPRARPHQAAHSAQPARPGRACRDAARGARGGAELFIMSPASAVRGGGVRGHVGALGRLPGAGAGTRRACWRVPSPAAARAGPTLREGCPSSGPSGGAAASRQRTERSSGPLGHERGAEEAGPDRGLKILLPLPPARRHLLLGI